MSKYVVLKVEYLFEKSNKFIFRDDQSDQIVSGYNYYTVYILQAKSTLKLL